MRSRTKKFHKNRKNKKTKRNKKIKTKKNKRNNKLKGGSSRRTSRSGSIESMRSLYGPVEEPCPRDMNWRPEIPQCVVKCAPQKLGTKDLSNCKECELEFRQHAASRRWWTIPNDQGEQFRRHYCRACGGTVCEGCAFKGVSAPEFNCEGGEDLKRNQWVCGTCVGFIIKEKSVVDKGKRKSRGSNLGDWDDGSASSGVAGDSGRVSTVSVSPFVTESDQGETVNVYRSGEKKLTVKKGKWRRPAPGQEGRTPSPSRTPSRTSSDSSSNESGGFSLTDQSQLESTTPSGWGSVPIGAHIGSKKKNQGKKKNPK